VIRVRGVSVGLLGSDYVAGNFRERFVGVCAADFANCQTAKASRPRIVQHLLRQESSSYTEHPVLTGPRRANSCLHLKRVSN
jgi:hypothetical protein